ncbi:hypothetical protein ACIBL8_38050 [Streptomyces sp. NPDC050523]|uniref:hypothetical protein n=1 Tax=Streptomyces sp. NPDC050523 TaxID=3365622 RepID=UPI0037B862FD
MVHEVDDRPSTPSEKRLVRAVVGGLILIVTALVGLLFLLVLVITVAAFPKVVELDSPSSLLWALLLLAPCSVIASAITVPVRRLVRARFAPSATMVRISDAAFAWLSAFLVGVMLLDWTPGVQAHSILPAVAAATAGLLLDPLVERWGKRRTRE